MYSAADKTCLVITPSTRAYWYTVRFPLAISRAKIELMSFFLDIRTADRQI
jgi:hypothetical protein